MGLPSIQIPLYISDNDRFAVSTASFVEVVASVDIIECILDTKPDRQKGTIWMFRLTRVFDLANGMCVFPKCSLSWWFCHPKRNHNITVMYTKHKLHNKVFHISLYSLVLLTLDKLAYTFFIYTFAFKVFIKKLFSTIGLGSHLLYYTPNTISRSL